MADLKKAIGKRVRLLREARVAGPKRGGRRRSRTMTIEELAERATLSVQYVNKLELGGYMPTIETLLQIAKALEVDVQELLPAIVPRKTGKSVALDELRAYAAQFSENEIQYLLRVAKTVMEKPRSRK